jgi:glycosyltransferase involved in cell wall biosynthesis
MQKKGFNLVGYATSPSGLGEDLRSFAAMLDYLGMPFSVTDLPTDGQGQVKVDWKNLTAEDYGTSFFFMASTECARLARAYPALFSDPKTRIGYFLWELPDYPRSRASELNVVDQIWCPTAFVQRAFTAVTKKLVLAIPLPVQIASPAKIDFRKALGIPKSAFVSLFMFDLHSTLNRKNPQAVVQSFLQFAGDRQDVYLILKLNRWERVRDDSLAWLPDDERIKILPRRLDSPALSALYKSADCYLSLHRSEGFGRTLVEALQHGLCLVTTDFSGPADFVNEDNALLVDWTRRDVQPGDYPNAEASWWAEPSIGHAVNKLEQAWAEPQRQRRKHAKETGNKFLVAALAQRYAPILMHYLK